MSKKPTNYTFPPWSSSPTYQKGDTVGSYTSTNEYFYATQASTNQAPLNNWTLDTSTYVRKDGVITITTSSSITPAFTMGSYVVVSGCGVLNYTGTLIDGGGNYICYPSPGPDDSGNVIGGKLWSNLNPAWTTGYGWIPSYAGQLDTKLNTVEASFGDSYSQRMRAGINTNKNTFSLVYENITSREAVAISNYVQEKGGVNPVKVILGDGELQPNTLASYKLFDVKISPKSRNVNSVSVTAEQVFDPS
jgi:phage-related protein